MKRRLTCCCCGEHAGTFEQWHNRDTGWGVCRPCAVLQKAEEAHSAALGHPVDPGDSLEARCGREGINWATEDQWEELLRTEREPTR